MSSEHRFVITDRLWQRIAPLLPGKATDRGVTAGDNHLFLEAVLWKVRTGAPWPDLPPLLRKVEQPVPPLPPLGQQRCVSEVIRGPQGRS